MGSLKKESTERLSAVSKSTDAEFHGVDLDRRFR
jgi:hypothetical protein